LTKKILRSTLITALTNGLNDAYIGTNFAAATESNKLLSLHIRNGFEIGCTKHTVAYALGKKPEIAR